MSSALDKLAPEGSTMQATIADIRRGDRFTWAGHHYIAADDARPSTGGGMNGYCDILTLPGTLKPSDDGAVHQGSNFGRYIAVRADFEIDITQRGVQVVMLNEEPDLRDESGAVGADPQKAVRERLAVIAHQRKLARRVVDDIDETRDEWIRTGLRNGMSVKELQERTGLSRQRIYQIRDGRR